MIPSPTVIRRTSHQKQAGYYRTALQYTDDMEMWLRLATLGKVGRTGHPQAVQRFHSTRHTNQFLETLVWDFTEREKAIRSFFQLEGAGISDADKMSALATRSLGCHAYWAGLSQTMKGNLDLANGRAIFSFAFSRCPSAFLFPPVLWLYKHKYPHSRMKSRIARRFRVNLRDQCRCDRQFQWSVMFVAMRHRRGRMPHAFGSTGAGISRKLAMTPLSRCGEVRNERNPSSRCSIRLPNAT